MPQLTKSHKLILAFALFYAVGTVVNSISHYIEDNNILMSVEQKAERIDQLEDSVKSLQEKVDKLEKRVQNLSLNER